MSLRRANTAAVLLTGLALACGGQVPARAYLHTDQKPSSEETAYAYVIWPARISDARMPRALVVCESYLRHLEPVARLRVPASQVIITYWLLASTEGSWIQEDCPTLIETYDYPRAAVVAADVKKSGAAGPLLVAYGHGSSGESTADTLVLDLTDFSNEDIDRAFGIWKDRIARDPEVWRDGFRLIVVRETLRNFLNKYGESILEAAPR